MHLVMTSSSLLNTNFRHSSLSECLFEYINKSAVDLRKKLLITGSFARMYKD